LKDPTPGPAVAWKRNQRRYAEAKSIGLISDTHGLLRNEALRALRGADLIIHAGDVGKPEILAELEELAPLVVVRGNVDTAEWAATLPATAVTEAGTAMIYVLHNLDELDLDPAAAGFHVVVSGHTHNPGRIERKGVLYINPGSAGPRRFDFPITVARLNVDAIPFQLEFFHLDGRKA
jgi:putative phosphoesterase